jgi:hypothetical protein
MDTKLLLTKEFLKDSGLPDDKTSLEKYLWTWWINPRLNGERSLGLTEQGYQVISQQVGLKFYQIDLPKDIQKTNQLIIWLDKFIDCPWYINNKSIYVSREKVAVQLMLFSGDLQKFGQSKNRAIKAADSITSNT